MIRHYRLRGHEVEECFILLDWAEWLENADRQVARTHIDIGDEGNQGIEVLTWFLGLDYRHFGDGPPIVFETMVSNPPEPVRFFGRERVVRRASELGGGPSRYCTWAEAETGHAQTVQAVREHLALIRKQAEEALAQIARREVQ